MREAAPPRHLRHPERVEPICSLVQEALSARLDGEEQPVDAGATARHLERCAACRSFDAAAARLPRIVDPGVGSPGRHDVVRVLATAARRRGTLPHAVERALQPFGSARSQWALPVMALAVALPPLSLGVLSHVGAAHPDAHVHCATFLAHLAARR